MDKLDRKNSRVSGILEPIISGAVVLVALIVFVVIAINLTGQRNQARDELAEYKSAVRYLGENASKNMEFDEELIAMLDAHFKAIYDGDDEAYKKTLKNPSDEKLLASYDANSFKEYTHTGLTFCSDSIVLDDGSEEMILGMALAIAGSEDGRFLFRFMGVEKDDGKWVVTRYL